LTLYYTTQRGLCLLLIINFSSLRFYGANEVLLLTFSTKSVIIVVYTLAIAIIIALKIQEIKLERITSI